MSADQNRPVPVPELVEEEVEEEVAQEEEGEPAEELPVIDENGVVYLTRTTKKGG